MHSLPSRRGLVPLYCHFSRMLGSSAATSVSLQDPFKTSLLWVTLTLPSSAASEKYRIALATSGAQLLCADSQETISQKVCLSDAGLFLIPDNLSAPAAQHGVAQQSQGFTLVVLYLVNHGWFFGPG